LASWARDAGLTLSEQKGLTYNLLSKRYSLGNDLDVNYLAYYSKPEIEAIGQ
jgi:2-polyprenyl-6-hydroxyphenyl methylase/3-demethylubiquinone-9 3-methyltransferase